MNKENIKQTIIPVVLISTIITPILSILSEVILSDVTHYDVIRTISGVLLVIAAITAAASLTGAIVLKGGQRFAAIACLGLNCLFGFYYFFVVTFELTF